MAQDLTTTTTSTPSIGASKLDELRNLPARLDDDTLSRVAALASSPLRPLPAVSALDLDQRLALLFTLPRQKSAADIQGELRIEAYHRVLGNLPLAQVDWMVDAALSRCKWTPTPAECLEIAAGWHRTDEATEARRIASDRLNGERLARMADTDTARRRLKFEGMAPAEIAALPQHVIGDLLTQRIIRQTDDGTYENRAFMGELQ